VLDQVLDALGVEVDVLNVNDLQVNFILSVFQNIGESNARSFNVHILQKQLFEALLVLNHEFGDKIKLPERHVSEFDQGDIVVGVVVVADSLVSKSSLSRFGKVRQDEFFYLHVGAAFSLNRLNMAVVNLTVAVECDVFNARVNFGILEQDLAVVAGQLVVSQVKGLQTVTLRV